MTRIKLCGLFRPCDIEAANRLRPEYIGFVFAEKSRRYISYEKAAELKALLSPQIKSVGVFVDEKPERIADLFNKGVIDLAQLHGREDDEYIGQLRMLTDKPLIKAFRIERAEDMEKAKKSSADYILLDSGAGSGRVFNWRIIKDMKKPWFLAGGLSPDNVESAIKECFPYAIDVSSGIETDGQKDEEKMAAFVAHVRKEKQL